MNPSRPLSAPDRKFSLPEGGSKRLHLVTQECRGRSLLSLPNRPLRALFPDSSTRFLEQDFPRLSQGEYTGIEKPETSPEHRFLKKPSPKLVHTERGSRK